MSLLRIPHLITQAALSLSYVVQVLLLSSRRTICPKHSTIEPSRMPFIAGNCEIPTPHSLLFIFPLCLFSFTIFSMGCSSLSSGLLFIGGDLDGSVHLVLLDEFNKNRLLKLLNNRSTTICEESINENTSLLYSVTCIKSVFLVLQLKLEPQRRFLTGSINLNSSTASISDGFRSYTALVHIQGSKPSGLGLGMSD